MTESRRLRINLASDPVRNRRPFRTLAALILLPGIILGALAAGFFLEARLRSGRFSREAVRLERSIAQAGSEAARFKKRARDLARLSKARVDFANELIMSKSFSWAEFLSRLEKALPADGVVTSLAPSFAGGSRMEMTLGAVFENLNGLLAFTGNLIQQGFSEVRLLSEGRDGFGRLESEISVVYEGAH